MSDEQLCLLTVHAHPDDEASKGAGTVARAAAEGIKCVLVCCTGGEAGDILNPAMESDEVKARLPEIRMEELAESVRVIGYHHLELLGYRDSGMPESEHNSHPESFAQAPLEEAVERLVRIVRRHRPQVIVTYDEDQSGYPHPDHLRVHEISMHAFEAAGDPERFPKSGEPWQPLKLYYSAWSVRRMLAMHERMLELGIESPMDEERMAAFRAMGDKERTTTSVDINGFAHVREDALLAHRTQVDPKSPFWFGLPHEETERLHPFDDYVLARSLVDTTLPEDDLFRRDPQLGSALTAPFLGDGWVAAVATAAASGEPVQQAPSLELVVGEGRRGSRETRIGVAFPAAGPVLGPPDGDAEVTGSMGEADFAAVVRGELAFDTAYMQGRLKLVGPGSAVLAVLRATTTDAWHDTLRAVAEATDFNPPSGVE